MINKDVALNNDVALGILGILALIFFPFGLVWALNTLFSTGIEYSFWTWLASSTLFVWIRCSFFTPLKMGKLSSAATSAATRSDDS